MKSLMIHPEYGLYERDGKAFASSRDVAATFEKLHKDVLKAIRDLGCSAEFAERNFAPSSYRDSSGKKNLEILMTRDGFVLLAMGFTGKKAMAFKEAYIRRFNEMEAFIVSLASSRIDFPWFTDAVMAAHAEPKHYHFSNEINMIYRVAFGKDAKQLRAERGIESGASIRPHLAVDEIMAVEELQRADVGLLLSVPDFSKRKEALITYYERIQRKRLKTA